MDINELKEYVDSKIKENGKQEITGPVLNKVLNSTIDTLNDTASATTASAVEKLEGKITEETTARVQADDTMQADIATLKAIPIKKGKGIGAVIANDIEDNAAGGIYATAFGFITKAGGDSSFAEGYLTSARGGSSHAEGYGTTASGRASHAEGNGAKAGAYASHAEGLSTNVTAEAGHAQGKYNTAVANAIDIVGIGSSSTDTKNAEMTMTSGKKYILNVGGYDGGDEGTAKDVATVISDLESADTTNANNLATHIADTSNPHKVTASQVGASTPAEVASAISTHNTASNAHSDIRTLISNETNARQSADAALEAKIPTTTEDFVFTLEDGTEVTKSIYVK